jgi:CubicO group peptidase (beta-lactamase class C family)
MQLAERGSVDVDSPVQRYLPWFRVASERDSHAITLRLLLTHTSGLSTVTGYGSFRGSDSLGSRVRALRGVHLAHRPGSKFQYSNANYEVLGAVIEAVSGQRYDEYLRQHVFGPLGMVESSGGSDQAGVVRGYQSWFGLPRKASVPYLRANGPAGQVVSTAHDLARYLGFQLSGIATPGPNPVSAGGLAELHRPGPTVHAPTFVVPAHQHYAEGWYVGPLSGEHAVWHSGDVFNYSSELVLLPDRGIGIAVLVNESFLPVEPADRLGRSITALVVGDHPPRAGLRSETVTFIIDLLAAGYLWLAVGELVRVLRRTPPSRGPVRLAIRVGGADVVLPVALLGGLWAGTGGSLGVAWKGIPDVTAALITGSALLLCSGVVRAVSALASMAGRRGA